MTKYTIPIGTELIIETYLAKDGTNKAVGKNFTLPDGRRLFFGGSAPGASGLALSAYLTPGDLLLGGPRAMRRLRLSCEQWRAACFVLIPERPG